MIKLKDQKQNRQIKIFAKKFSYLLEKNNADACLVSFFADDYKDWRFYRLKLIIKDLLIN